MNNAGTKIRAAFCGPYVWKIIARLLVRWGLRVGQRAHDILHGERHEADHRDTRLAETCLMQKFPRVVAGGRPNIFGILVILEVDRLAVETVAGRAYRPVQRVPALSETVRLPGLAGDIEIHVDLTDAGEPGNLLGMLRPDERESPWFASDPAFLLPVEECWP